MTANLSRRFFLMAASSLALPRFKSSELPIHPFAIAIRNSLEARDTALDFYPITDFWESAEVLQREFIDTSHLEEILIGRIKAVEVALKQVFSCNHGGLNIINELFDAERVKLGMGTQDEMVKQDERIASSLQSVGIDFETWQDWAEEFLSDDRCGLDWPTGVMHFNTGGFSQYYMDYMTFSGEPEPVSKPAIQAVMNLCVRLHEAYPIHGSPAMCRPG